MPAFIIEGTKASTGEEGSSAGVAFTDVPLDLVLIPPTVEQVVDIDLFGEWEDKVWGQVDAVYEYGQATPIIT